MIFSLARKKAGEVKFGEGATLPAAAFFAFFAGFAPGASHTSTVHGESHQQVG